MFKEKNNYAYQVPAKETEEETLNCIDYILRKYNRKQKLVKEEIEYVLKYLRFYSIKRSYNFLSYPFEIISSLLLIGNGLFFFSIFSFFSPNITLKIIWVALVIMSNLVITYGEFKIREKIAQEKVTKLTVELEQLLNPVEEVRKEAITEEKEEVPSKEVDTFLIYIGRLYNIIKTNGLENFRDEIKSLRELAYYYMEAKKEIGTTAEINIFYKCPDLWPRFNEIEEKVNQKIKCASDIEVNEKYLSSLNMGNQMSTSSSLIRKKYEKEIK